MTDFQGFQILSIRGEEESMEFIRKIRKDNGMTYHDMKRRMGIKNVNSYVQFEKSKLALNADKMIRLWRFSGLSAKAFMTLIEEEVKSKEKLNRRAK
ncbi:hypothetical protein I4641_13795 [Waterburya agarophytonicola K14]|uniref:Uncharacterized protein n=1 Tax=Waterburya agarophytonicola KI4 TaxID=2874699 RepID=A0A964BR02_9CYAN|nr:helix-turn-helix domain-containing protein [Waterburya agarophytonicola]MCC0178053.1 hypothetical protein [Waterburya agarophytonicola KI4]